MTATMPARILAGTPRLSDAACCSHVGTFDRAADGDRDAAREAVEICRRCPVLDTCAKWIADVYPQRPPPGVWGARYQPPTRSRKKDTTNA